MRLTEIYRQAGASQIVLNADRVNRGEMPILASAEAAGGNFFIIDRRTPEELETLLHQVAERIPASFGSIRWSTFRCSRR